MYFIPTKRIILFSLIIVITQLSLNFGQNKLTPLPDAVSIYHLDNGLEVLLIEKPTLPMVGINTIVKVGSAYENYATSGMSHMLEHLLFNGTTSMTQKELYDSTDIIGGYNNAHTGDYFTNFMMVTPAENIIAGMKLQSEMLFNSVIPDEKFEKEKGIVLEEIAKSLSKPAEQLERNILSVIFEGHSLSLPTLGTYSTIENFERDNVFDFYKNYYVPNNMILSVIGNFNSLEMIDNIKDIYGIISPKTVKNEFEPNLSFGFEKFINQNLDRVFHRFYNGESTQLQIFFEMKDRQSKEFNEILMLSLDKNKKKIKEELVNVYGDQIEGIEFSSREIPVTNYLQVTLFLKDDKDIEDVKKTFLEQLYQSKLEVAEETIINESIKTRTRFLKNIEKPHMFGIYNAEIFAEQGIEGILTSYSGSGYFEALNKLNEFTIPTRNITIVQHPIEENKQANNEENIEVVVFSDIPNGAKIIAKQAKGSDLLAIHYLIKNKAELEQKYGKGAAKMWHDAFGKRMESSRVKRISSQFGFTFTVNDNPFIPMDNIYLNDQFGYIRAEGLADSIESAIKFLNDQMLNFVPTEEEFGSIQEKGKRPSMMGHSNKVKSMFEEKLDFMLYEKDKFTSGKPDMTYEDLLKFGSEYFVPSNMILSIVSPESNANIKKYCLDFAKESNSINNELAYIKEFKLFNESSKIELDGGGKQSYLYYGFLKSIEEDEKSALKVLSLILSDNIIFDIREKQGLAYRMTAGIEIRKRRAMFYINMGTRPEKVDKLIPQFPEYFTPKFSKIVTDDLVKKAVNMYLGRMMFRRLSSINQAYYLGYSEYFNGDINYDSKSLNKLKQVTADDVQDMIKKYMSVENPVEIYIR